MPRIVIGPDGKKNEFPDGVTDAQISAALGAIPAANAGEVPQAKTWTDWAVDMLPAAGATLGATAGGVGGAVVGGPAGIPGAALGGALGGSIGESARQVVNAVRGAGPLKTPSESLIANAEQSAIGAAAGAAGEVGSRVIGAVVRGAGAVTPSAATAGRAMSSTGQAMQDVADTPVVKWGSSKLSKLLGIGGKGVKLAGQALESRGTPAAATQAPNILRERLAQIPIAGAESEAADIARAAIQARLRKIPLADRLAAIPEQMLSADVDLVRQAIASGKITFEKAITAAAEGSAEYAGVLKHAVVDSIKTKGVPVPDAVVKLLQSKSFANLPKP